MYDVKLQGSIGGGWALVCDIHYSYRQDDRFVVNLLTKGGAPSMSRKPSYTYCSASGKVIFKDELAAKLALARRVWKDKGEVRHYYCSHCKSYHLTSQKKGE